MNAAATLDASALIDSQPICRTQVLVFFLAFLITAFDGLDLQVISFVSLDMAREWNISRASLGAVFSMGLFGMMLGAHSLGTAGDIFGQRHVLVVLAALLLPDPGWRWLFYVAGSVALVLCPVISR